VGGRREDAWVARRTGVFGPSAACRWRVLRPSQLRPFSTVPWRWFYTGKVKPGPAAWSSAACAALPALCTARAAHTVQHTLCGAHGFEPHLRAVQRTDGPPLWPIKRNRLASTVSWPTTPPTSPRRTSRRPGPRKKELCLALAQRRPFFSRLSAATACARPNERFSLVCAAQTTTHARWHRRRDRRGDRGSASPRRPQTPPTYGIAWELHALRLPCGCAALDACDVAAIKSGPRGPAGSVAMEAAADALLGEAACLELLAAVSIRAPPRRTHARIACAHTGHSMLPSALGGSGTGPLGHLT
jgi:hypothetical protein